jgi:superfamily I DNA/RNA helicase
MTDEQQIAVQKIKEPTCNLLKIAAKSGSGKTYLLIKLAEELNVKSGMYLAYNKSIALEAAEKFSANVECMTTHSLAYKSVVRQLKLKVGFFGYKSIQEKMRYEHKLMTIDTITDFCLSKHTTFDNYNNSDTRRTESLNNINPKILYLAKSYLQKMFTGSIPLFHQHYLKLYHMMLASGKINQSELDYLAMDECGDINSVTLEIFKLLNAKKKVMVGDPEQNIYTFNKTVNGFKELSGIGEEVYLTRSFRCSTDIAKRVELFMNIHIDPYARFAGTDTPEPDIKDEVYISRTNSAMIGTMIELIKENKKFNMARNPKDVFELVLILLHLKPGGEVLSQEWNHMQTDADTWGVSESLQKEHGSVLSYILSKYGEDISIKTAFNMIKKYGYDDIMMAYTYAKKHKDDDCKHTITLSSSHSVKGLEFYKVYINDDLNASVSAVIEKKEPNEYDDKELELMRLYYVACTRASHVLLNAEHL